MLKNLQENSNYEVIFNSITQSIGKSIGYKNIVPQYFIDKDNHKHLVFIYNFYDVKDENKKFIDIYKNLNTTMKRYNTINSVIDSIKENVSLETSNLTDDVTFMTVISVMNILKSSDSSTALMNAYLTWVYESCM